MDAEKIALTLTFASFGLYVASIIAFFILSMTVWNNISRAYDLASQWKFDEGLALVNYNKTLLAYELYCWYGVIVSGVSTIIAVIAGTLYFHQEEARKK